jgi:endonuclease G, mitochondrial
VQYFDQETILEIHSEAVELGLDANRDQLLFGLSNLFIAQLNLARNPNSQLLSDLTKMNQVPAIIGDVVPLYVWLRNAAYAVAYLPDKQVYFRGRADEVTAKRAATVERSAAKQPTDLALTAFPEKIIFVNDMVPFGFLKGADRTGSSTARLIVPSFQGGQPRTFPSTIRQKEYFGTGWLIGPKHVITCHHVINARDEGEAAASDADFKLQAESTTVHFDYDSKDAAGLKFNGIKLCIGNIALDYAIIELPEKLARPPLTMWGGNLQLGDDSYLPVNIIQHPGGNAKQMGIRNNLATRLTERDLSYFTDTEGGSSGSAVCNDDWKVIALHKMSVPTYGKLQYQGKTTAWVNSGTRIDKIITDLKSNHGELWDKIGATIAS